MNNVLHGRYCNPSDDLKRLLLGQYGPFPFYDPPEWIYKQVLESNRSDGKTWRRILRDEGGIRKLPDEDFDLKRSQLEMKLKRTATDEELCLYLQFPRDAADYFVFEERFGKTWMLPPEVWFRRKRFVEGERITIPDYDGKTHSIDVVSTRRVGDSVQTSLLVDYHFQTYTTHIPDKMATGH